MAGSAELLLSEEAPLSMPAELRRRLDCRLLPLLSGGYLMSVIDRSNLAYAELQMRDDLSLSQSSFGLAAGVFFLSYCAAQVPTCALVSKLGARREIRRQPLPRRPPPPPPLAPPLAGACSPRRCLRGGSAPPPLPLCGREGSCCCSASCWASRRRGSTPPPSSRSRSGTQTRPAPARRPSSPSVPRAGPRCGRQEAPARLQPFAVEAGRKVWLRVVRARCGRGAAARPVEPPTPGAASVYLSVAAAKATAAPACPPSRSAGSRAARAFPLGVGVGRYGERWGEMGRESASSASSRPLCVGFPRCRLGTSIGASSSGALLQSLDGALGLAGWRWLFLVQEPDPRGDRSTQLTVNHIRI